MASRAKILVLYDAYSTFTQTVVEHLRSFAEFSAHDVFYAHAVRRRRAPIVPLETFDAIVIHYSVRLCYPNYLSPVYEAALAAYKGPKLVFIQDEYDNTELTRKRLEALGVSVVFTCVPPGSIEQVYPRARFPRAEFVTVLTGYVPPRFEAATPRKPIHDRKTVVAYRGRPLAFWYGKLAREKLVIGQQMKELCAKRGVAADIEWSEESRIYGEGWYEFLASAKATLGTESGANVFDDEGKIRRAVTALLAEKPGATFDEVFEKLLAPHEGKVRMNQISPKMFEAISLGTALILYEGEYSGILEAGRHYIALKKDLSNADAVFAALADDAGLQALADRAWTEIIGSGRWSYSRAVADFDAVLRRHLGARPPVEPFTIVLGQQDTATRESTPGAIRATHRLGDMITSAPIRPEQIGRDAGYVPITLKLARKLWAWSYLGAVLERVRGW